MASFSHTDILQVMVAVLVIAPIMIIFVVNLLPNRAVSNWMMASIGLLSAVQMAAAIYCAYVLWYTRNDFIQFHFFSEMGYTSVYLTVDFLSLLMLFVIAMVVFAAVIAARRRIAGEEVSFCTWMMLALLTMNAATMVNDLFSLFLTTEIISFITMILGNSDGMRARPSFVELLTGGKGIKALIPDLIALGFWLVGLLIFRISASWDFDQLYALLYNGLSAWQVLAMVLIATAVAYQAKLIPFQSTKAEQLQASSAHVSVLRDGILVKISSVYVLFRLVMDVFGPNRILVAIFLVLGLISVVLGSYFSCVGRNLKVMQVYSSISRLGYMVLGIVSGNIVGWIGAATYMVCHAISSSVTLINNDVLERQFGSADLDVFGGGLSRSMRFVSATSFISHLSNAAMPPLAGFWAKLLIVIGLWQAGYVAAAVIATLATLFGLYYFLRVAHKVFLGAPTERVGVVDSRGMVRFITVLYSAILVLAGIAYPWILLFLHSQGIF